MPIKHRLGSFFSKQLPLTLLLVGLLVLLAVPLARNFKRQQAVNKEIAALQSEASQAENQNSQFKKMIDYLQSDQFVEEQAKINFDLKRQGEKVAVITGQPDAANPGEISGASQPAVPEPQTILSPGERWGRWWDYFFAFKP